MIQQLDEKTSGAWRPSPGAIYPAIAQLEDERLVEPFDNEGARAFRLTEDGSAAAARIDTKPWETVNEEFGPRSPREAARLWESYGALAMAARAVMGTGTPAQVDEAVEILAEARRRLFGLLSRD